MISAKANINIAQIQKGNHLEFSRLVAEYSKDLHVFAKGFVGDSETAEEIVSDVFLKLWQKRNKLEEINNLANYLFIAVRNASLSFLRSKKLNIVSLEDLPDYHINRLSAPDDQSIAPDIMDTINAAIEKLPSKCKLVFSMSKIQGFKNKEIATLLEISEKTVEYHLKTAIERLINSLQIDKGQSKQQSGKIISLLFGSIF